MTIGKRSHEVWEGLSSKEVRQYINKYHQSHAPGKCSSRRRKKIKYLQNILHRRDKAMHLLTGHN